MQKEKLAQLKSLKYAILFFFLFFALIAVVLFVRLIITFFHSRYDGSHRFTIDVIEDSSTHRIFSFAPDTQTISVLTVQGMFDSSVVERTLQIPVDATIQDSRRKSAQPIPDFLFFLTTHFGQFDPQGLTFIDAFRLYLFSQHIKPENVSSEHITLSHSQVNDSDQKWISQLFVDQTLYQENVSVSVVNATDSSGVGSRFAKMLSNMGANVVSVTTGNTQQSESTIAYFGSKTYTLTRIEKVFHVKTITLQKPSVSDIIITIGENDLGTDPL